MDSLQVLRQLVAVPGPPGEEGRVRDAVAGLLEGFETETDVKGNLLVRVGPRKGEPQIVVTAHLDEVALMVQRVHPDGALGVVPLGGVHPWKWGEGPVEILAEGGPVPAILSFGSMHTEDPSSTAVQAREEPLTWEQTRLFTGLSPSEIAAAGIRPGTRAALATSRRVVTEVGSHVGSYFLDDRADVVAWLLALEALKKDPPAAPVLFAATTSEEVGGEGARWLMHRMQPAVCVALELGPVVPDADVKLTAEPTAWAKDGYASIDPRDAQILSSMDVPLQWQVLSRGGSDASCAASLGLTARPVTLGIPMENTHGYEIMHRDAMTRLAEATTGYIHRVASQLKD